MTVGREKFVSFVKGNFKEQFFFKGILCLHSEIDNGVPDVG